MTQKDFIVPNAPLWLQRSRSEIAEARRLCITFAQVAQQLQRKDVEGASSVLTQMVQFAMRTCVTVRHGTTFFHMLKEAAESGGQSFTPDDVEEAERLYLEALAHQRLARPLAKSNCNPSAASSGDEGASSGDELSGEEAVDKEVPVRVTPELLADLGAKLTAEELAVDDGYATEAWEKENSHICPGESGFNRRANVALHHAGLACMGGTRANSRDAATCPPLQPHQEIVGFLMHPKSPMKKLLVDHPTGSGKTWEMIRVLDNFFYDPRPKIPIFPKAVVCRNFYMELLRWPNRYRDYFCCERPQDAAIACGSQLWQDCRRHMWDINRLPETMVRQLCRSCRDVLEMKGQSFRGMMRKSFRAIFRERHPGEPMPLTPLRAVTYASAGGAFSAIVGGQPLSAVMKIGYEGSVSSNVYSSKVVLMDEIHNLVRTETKYSQQLCHLRDLLVSAVDLVLVGFTGTPILSQPCEGRQLLSIVKGDKAGTSEEGFMSSLASRPKMLFPKSLPAGIPDGILTLSKQRQFVHKVELHDEALNAYDRKRQRGLVGQRLRSYCNVCSFASSFHEGRGGSKAAILGRPDACCPKLLTVAEAIANSSEKAVVMTGRSSGYRVMLEILRQMSAKSNDRFGVATMDDLAGFNHVSNLRGQTLRVLVADSAQCSEGVSFLAVRRVFITDVPSLHSQFVQMCGRSIRMYGHRGLGADEQNVVTNLYIATLPKWMKSSLACWAFRAQARYKSGKTAESCGKALLQKLQDKCGFKTLQDLKTYLDSMCSRPEAVVDQESTDDHVVLDRKKLREFLSTLGHTVDESEGNGEVAVASSQSETNAFIQAAKSLCFSSSIDDASLALSLSTADEDALQELSRQSQEIAPALADMRLWSVDKEFLQCIDENRHAHAAPSSFMPNGSNTSLVLVSSNDTSQVHTQASGFPSNVKPTRRLRSKTSVEALGAFIQTCEPSEAEGNAESSELLPGQHIKIKGLTGARHLNGVSGVVEQLDEASGRWIIRLENTELKSLKRENCCVESLNHCDSVECSQAKVQESSQASTPAIADVDNSRKRMVRTKVKQTSETNRLQGTGIIASKRKRHR